MKNRDFTFKGVNYHLNDNIYKNEFEGKYILMVFCFDHWQRLITCDTKKAARSYVKENYLYI